MVQTGTGDCMAVQRPDLPPPARDPDERDLARRSRGGSLNPVLIMAAIVLIGVAVFVMSSL
jgi:hypothetical protein